MNEQSASPPGEVTLLLAELRRGNRHAESRLMELIYGELRRLAGQYLRRERTDHTLQPTALVHEAYLRLIRQRDVNWKNRAHFFGVAAQLMRRILVDHARARRTGKRGGEVQKLPLQDALAYSHAQAGELLALDQALVRLAEWDPRQSHIVELRYFGGLSVEETAEVLGISARTVKRDWNVARAWLLGQLRPPKSDDSGAMEHN